MSSLRSNVLSAAKRRLAEGQDHLRERQPHLSSVELCAEMTKLRDEVVLTLAAAALDDLGELEPESVWSQVALVAHGGYGRRDVAPIATWT